MRFALICSSIFTLVATSYQLYSGYTADRSTLINRLIEIETTSVPIISESVWQLDIAAVDLLLEGLANLDDIVFVELTRGEQSHAFGIKPETQEYILQRKYDLVYKSSGATYALGTLLVNGTLENALATAKERLFVILYSNAIKTFLLSFAIFFGFQYLIMRHLSHLASYVKSMNFANSSDQVELDRPQKHKSDELTDLASCVNELSFRIANSINELSEQKNWLTLVTDNLPVLIAYIDNEKRYRFCNQRYEQWFGQRPETLYGETLKNALGSDTYELLHVHVLEALAGKAQSFVCSMSFQEIGQRLVSFDYVPHIENGKVKGFFSLGYDKTEKNAYEAKIYHLANYDSLTGLLNREAFRTVLESLIHSKEEACEELALFFIDLDNFKRVNDVAGHDVGDTLLQTIADRLRKITPDEGIVSRLSGDEFTIALKGISSLATLKEFTSAILSDLRMPVEISESTFNVSCSIGISRYPQDGDTVVTLLKCADLAMYRAKLKGRNTYQIFNRELNKDVVRSMQLSVNLPISIREKHFVLLYQPIVETCSGRVVGCEALIRWHHPEMGLIGPQEFIPIAEENGTIIPLGEWILEEACQQLAEWNKDSLSPIYVSVNISARQFLERRLIDTFKRVLVTTKINPSQLVLELTESIVMENVKENVSQLSELNELGIRLSIDDFGTGYSSMSYLKLFPIHYLKIDKSFVDDINNDSNSASIVHATVAMAHALHLSVIAEGVEDAAQLEFLKDCNCEAVQGYLFNPPLAAKEMGDLLTKQQKSIQNRDL